MQIITGKTGSPHVSAEHDRAKHAGVFGKGEYVLNTGSNFKATVETSDTIRLGSGAGMMQGTLFCIEHSNYDDVNIDNGTTGYMRKDLICAEYKKVADIESIVPVVVKGEPSVNEPQTPAYTHGNILEGATFNQMPLYEVLLDGVNVVSVTQVFNVATGLDDVYRKGETYTKNEVNSIKNTLQTNIDTAQSTANAATQELSEHSEVIEELVMDRDTTIQKFKDLQDNIDYVYGKLELPVGCGILSKSDIDATVFQYGNWGTSQVTLGEITYNLHIRIS